MLNAGSPGTWADDIARSVAMYNEWFVRFAPQVFRDEKIRAAREIIAAMDRTADFTRLDADTLLAQLGILPVLRMATRPPIARDRLTGLSGASVTFVDRLDAGSLPARMPETERLRQARLVASTLSILLDRDLFPWLDSERGADESERLRAADVLADRLCTAVADPIVRNAQEARQLEVIEALLLPLGYRRGSHPATAPLQAMPAGTYQFRLNVMGGHERQIRIPVDCVIQPRAPRPSGIPVLIEAKSAGDFTNTNKRRKEESDKYKNLVAALGDEIDYVLFLCGYFNETYLAYEAAEGMDFVWEHRPEDLLDLGL